MSSAAAPPPGLHPEHLQKLKSNGIILQPLETYFYEAWKQKLTNLIVNNNHKNNKNNETSSWSAIRKDLILDSMVFVLENGERHAFHLIEMLILCVDPIARAKEIKDVSWRLNNNSNNNQTSNQQQYLEIIHEACRKILTGLFLLSDILMNTTTTTKQQQTNTNTTSNNNKNHDELKPETLRQIQFVILFFFETKFIQQLGEFIVLTKRREIQEEIKRMENEGSPNHSMISLNLNLIRNTTISNNIDQEDPISVILGWIRELWALWKVNQVLPGDFVARMEASFGFMLITPTRNVMMMNQNDNNNMMLMRV